MREAVEPVFGTEPAATAVTVEASPDARLGARAVRPGRSRRRWPWLLLAALLTVMVLTSAVAAGLIAMFRQAPESAQISLQGQNLLQQVSQALTAVANDLVQTWPWLGDIDWNVSFDGLSVGALTLGLLALFIGAVLVVLGVLALVPLVLLASLTCTLLATVAALLLAAGAVALSLSPLWLPVLGLWWWLRRRTAARPGSAAAAAPI